MGLAIDFSPVQKYRDYRYLFIGQLVSKLGSMTTYVAFQFHIYEITKSTFWVGLTGVVQLVPLVLTGFWGGALADSFNRRRLILWAEGGLAFVLLLLAAMAYFKVQSAPLLLVLSALSACLTGIHRPALEALTPRLVPKSEIPKVSSLNSFQHTIGAIGGPALGGVLIATIGLYSTYIFDALSFLFSMFCLWRIHNVPVVEKTTAPSFNSIMEGFNYAIRRRDLLGTYLIDMVAMFFAFPFPLFPAFAEHFGGVDKLGWLYSAPSIGALLATISSGWTYRIKRHGWAITIAASIWCLALIAFGATDNYHLCLLFLIIAGAADMVSGIFRGTIWNETIPDNFRGRLAGVEMISYMSGPMAGNTWMGFLAQGLGLQRAIMLGGLIGTMGVSGVAIWLKDFRNYKSADPEDRPLSR